MKILILTLTMLMFLGLDCKKKTTEPQDTFKEPELRDIEASWSPDGQWIVYRHEDYNITDNTYQNGLYIIDTNGNNRRLLLRGEALLPDWSPGGNKIAFCSGAIYTINVDGDSLALLVNVGRFPRWSPDGSMIIYTRAGTQDTVGIWIYVQQTNTIKRFGYGAMPDWSPNGTKLVYSCPADSISSAQIWTIDTTSTNRIQLTNTNADNYYPKWSPDGAWITWTIVTYENGGGKKIGLMKSNGTEQRIFRDGFSPSWSSSSRKIVFSNFNKGKTKYVLWVININGSGLKQITQ